MPEITQTTHSTPPAGASPSARLALGLSASTLPDIEAIEAALPAYADFAVLGEGGMGVVFRAHHRRLDRPVAIKMIRPDLAQDPLFAERFAREARALARLQHPGIVGIHEVGEVLGTHYLVMEYVDGTDLRSRLESGLGPAESLTLVAQICDALAYAHAQGVVHRDIKPENILVDGHGRVKIADFGLAKLASVAEPSLTGSRMLGTPHYMAPEQLGASSEVDHRADIFALGVVLYEMLTGRLPLGRFDPPSCVRPLDTRIDDVVLRSLEHDRERRFQTAKEVRDRVVAIRPTDAEPPASSPEEIEREADREMRRSRWALLGWLGAWLAVDRLAGCSWTGVPFVGDDWSFRSMASESSWPLVVVLVAFFFRRAHVNGKTRGTRRGDALLVRTSALMAGALLSLGAYAVVHPSAFGLGAKAAISAATLAAATAVAAAWQTWTLAAYHGVPARIVFGPSWWIPYWVAGLSPEKSRR